MGKESSRWLTATGQIIGATVAGAILMGAASYRPGSEDPFPADVRMKCPAGTSKVSFADWFAVKKVTAGGLVNPPDSVKLNAPLLKMAPPSGPIPGFDPHGGPDFYRWAYQMFLHVTSPTRASNGECVFASPEFYALSPANPNTGERHFIAQNEPGPKAMEIRKGKPAAGEYSLIRDTDGNPYIVVPQKVSAKGNRVVTNKGGKEVEVSATTLDASGKPVFVNLAGKPIPGGKPVMSEDAPAEIAGRVGTSASTKRSPTQDHPSPVPLFKHVVNGNTVFTDGDGNVVSNFAPELTQPDGGVQLTRAYQSGGKTVQSLVYYSLAYNDAFAYYRTMVKHGHDKFATYSFEDDFPDRPQFMTTLEKYAKEHGHSIAHPDALVIELKMAWVEAAAVSNPKEYITITARIPAFNTSNSNRWVQNGTKVTQLALVGMHIVGSTGYNDTGIWATFEHQNNAPAYAYRYTDNKGNRVSVPAAKGDGKDYLFGMPESGSLHASSGAAMGPETKSGEITITGMGGHDISGTSVYRLSPFGSPYDEAPNDVDRSPAASNTTLISLNRDVYERMPDGDPRKYYFLVGATWDTVDGLGPDLLWTQTAKPWHDGNDSRNIEGTPFVANTTMETFEQAPSYAQGGAAHFKLSGGGGPNKKYWGDGRWWNQVGWQPAWHEIADGPAVGCFSCHTGSTIAAQSHVFSLLKPLW